VSTNLKVNQTSVNSLINTSVPSTPTIFSVFDPDVGSLDPNGTSTTARPWLGGGGVSGDVVTVYDNGVAIGSVVVDPNGSWGLTPAFSLANGAHALTATDTNAAGSVSPQSNAFDLTINAAPPAAPTIFSVLDPIANISLDPNGTSISARPMLGGGGTAGDVVTIYDNGIAIGSAVVNAVGSWNFTPTTDLSNGVHALTAMDVNAAGAVSHLSIAFDLTIGVGIPPVAPTIFSVFDPITGSLDPNGTSESARPSLGGGGVVGDIVTVYDNGAAIGTALVGKNGSWYLVQTSDMTNGEHALTATQSNVLGDVSHASLPFDLTVNVGLPAAPVITSIVSNDGPMLGAVAAGGISTDGHPVINGTGHIGDTISVYDNTTFLGTAVVNPEGHWSYQPAAALANGTHNLHATETNLTGTSVASAAYPLSVTYIMITAVHDANGQPVASGGTSSGALTISGWISDPSIASNGSVIDVTGGNLPNDWKRMGGLELTVVGNTFTVTLSKDTFTGASDISYLTSGTFSFGVEAFGSMGHITTMVDPRLAYTVTDDFNATLPALVTTHVDASTSVDDAALLAAHASVAPVASQAEHHVAVGTHDTFKGTAGDVTVDLNADPATYFKQATAHIEGGESGVHTLHLTGDHQVLDLASLTGKTSAAKVSGIEAVDLGGAHNMLKLSLVDVLNLAEPDLFQKDGKQQLLVSGSNGDSVDLSNAHIAGVAVGHWMQGGTAEVGGVTYNVYEHSGAHAELLVQQGVQIALHG
jgi:hypothetical protein